MTHLIAARCIVIIGSNFSKGSMSRNDRSDLFMAAKSQNLICESYPPKHCEHDVMAHWHHACDKTCCRRVERQSRHWTCAVLQLCLVADGDANTVASRITLISFVAIIGSVLIVFTLFFNIMRVARGLGRGLSWSSIVCSEPRFRIGNCGMQYLTYNQKRCFLAYLARRRCSSVPQSQSPHRRRPRHFRACGNWHTHTRM